MYDEYQYPSESLSTCPEQAHCFKSGNTEKDEIICEQSARDFDTYENDTTSALAYGSLDAPQPNSTLVLM